MYCSMEIRISNEQKAIREKNYHAEILDGGIFTTEVLYFLNSMYNPASFDNQQFSSLLGKIFSPLYTRMYRDLSRSLGTTRLRSLERKTFACHFPTF